MTSPIGVFNGLRETYFRYLDSPFDLRYPDLVNERRLLLDADTRLYREPLIEPVPGYQSSGAGIAGAAGALSAAGWPNQVATDVANFVATGLFPLQRELYVHQRQVFEESVIRGNDVVVTTGTGSGKTECFLLPVVASLVRESASWSAPGPRAAQWDWWAHSTPTATGNSRRWAARIPQRAHETRLSGMRALILYPLNALVEDQLARLRDALDSLQARQWLQSQRNGNRFYFGRYTRRAPISGGRNSNSTARLRAELTSITTDAQLVANSPAARFFPAMDGGEMWSRWDMQDHAPDILITNYSMLNIMLMRSVESSIFDQTRAWLAADRGNVFHLVVDELHTYRGTPGTEVAYLLRVLFDRLGLQPESPQLRIIASSASIGAGSTGQEYLESFFGRNRNRFQIISGTPLPINANAAQNIAGHRNALQQLGRDLEQQGLSASCAERFRTAVGAAARNPQDSPEIVIGSALQHIGATDALRTACSSTSAVGTIPSPQPPSHISRQLFPNDTADDASHATAGLLAGLCSSRTRAGTAPLPIRSHIFFRNLQGIWACSNPSCTAAPRRHGAPPVGSLHYSPTLTCTCGSRVLELLYCEPCGETYLGGYRRETGNANEWYLGTQAS